MLGFQGKVVPMEKQVLLAEKETLVKLEPMAIDMNLLATGRVLKLFAFVCFLSFSSLNIKVQITFINIEEKNGH